MIWWQKTAVLIIGFVCIGCADLIGAQFLPPAMLRNEAKQDITSSHPSLSLLPSNKDFSLSFKKRSQLDILFVVDTHYSMRWHLTDVDKKFKSFLDNLSPLDWKIGITNADYDLNPLAYYDKDLLLGRVFNLEWAGQILNYKYIYASSQYSKEIFIDTLKFYEPGDIDHIPSDQYINPCNLPPYCQGDVRSPVKSLMNAILINKNLLRRNSNFVTVIFTNGDDKSIDEETIKSFLSWFQDTYNKTIKVYSISIPPGATECFYNKKHQLHFFSQSSYSNNVSKLVQTTKGYSINICSEDYSTLASLIAKDFLHAPNEKLGQSFFTF